VPDARGLDPAIQNEGSDAVLLSYVKTITLSERGEMLHDDREWKTIFMEHLASAPTQGQEAVGPVALRIKHNFLLSQRLEHRD
jgi:hypothetical protein